MENLIHDPTFLWCATYFSSSFAQGKTMEELAFWAAVFTLVGDELALLATESPFTADRGETETPSVGEERESASVK